MDKKPRHLTRKGANASTSASIFHLKCDNYILQSSPDDTIAVTRGCHLIKLCQDHPAIDFLILDNSFGTKDSHKLFFIQVSAMKYQS